VVLQTALFLAAWVLSPKHGMLAHRLQRMRIGRQLPS